MDLKKLTQEAVRESLQKSGYLPKLKKEAKPTKDKKPLVVTPRSDQKSKILAEAQFITPQSFVLRTERLSSSAKRAHERLYNGYTDKFNKISSALDAANQQEANANSSDYRSLNVDRTYNLNATKLHELYFYNISDLASEISVDALPYMRLSRDFGNFEEWQFDFIAACRSAREGWAIVVFEPYRGIYMNVVVDSHNVNIPIGVIPVLVMDMWAHSYYKDYPDNKDDYIVAMMREINWNVVEARMALAEKSELGGLYMIRPIYNAVPNQMLDQAIQPPIEQVGAPGQIQQPQGQELPSSTPAVASPNYPRTQTPGGGY